MVIPCGSPSSGGMSMLLPDLDSAGQRALHHTWGSGTDIRSSQRHLTSLALLLNGLLIFAKLYLFTGVQPKLYIFHLEMAESNSNDPGNWKNPVWSSAPSHSNSADGSQGSGGFNESRNHGSIPLFTSSHEIQRAFL